MAIAAAGEFRGSELADAGKTRARTVGTVGPVFNEINYLAASTELRTKGSWVQFLPAAPLS
jgi:hypothetical protein